MVQPEWPGSHQVDCCSPSVHPLWLRNRQVNTLFSWHPDGCWNYIIWYLIKLLNIHKCRAFKMLQVASGQFHSFRHTVPNCIFAAQISIFFSIKDAEQVQWFAMADPRKSKGYSLPSLELVPGAELNCNCVELIDLQIQQHTWYIYIDIWYMVPNMYLYQYVHKYTFDFAYHIYRQYTCFDIYIYSI